MNILVRQAEMADLSQLLDIDKEIWPEFRASEEMIRSRLEVFPEGQFVALCRGEIVGSIYSQLVNYESLPKSFTWAEITDNGTIRRTHNANGDSVYGIGLAVLPKFQGTTASRLLIMALVNLTVELNRQQILFGARIPGYHKHKEMSVEQYIKKQTTKGRYIDPELAFYQKHDGESVRPLANYISDQKSLDYGVLVRWYNPNYVK